MGGFVFSGASDTVNILVRALKVQGRIDLLNAPNIQVLDNQVGEVAVGQLFPYVNGGQFTALGTFQPNIAYNNNVGVTLRVTPRISPEGRILMRVEPSIIEPIASPVSLGNGFSATAFNNQSITTTILADDGETVVIGGLISKSNQRTENKIPFFGDLPFVGALFRYRTSVQEKRELIIIMTPRIIRSAADADRVGIERMKQMNWNLADIEKTAGKESMDLINQAFPKKDKDCDKPGCKDDVPVAPHAQQLPNPLPIGGATSGPTIGNVTPASDQSAPSAVPTMPPVTEVPKKKERGWSLFGRN